MKKIVVLGGGTAGWLTALFLQKAYTDISITVVEDPKRPPIIAGESGTSTILKLYAYLDIDIADWLEKVNATPKMGGNFTDWNGIGTHFYHALQTDINFVRPLDSNISTFGEVLANTDGIQSADLYLRTLLANDIKLSDAFFAGEYIKQNKVPRPNHPFKIGNMWHFESRDNAAYLKAIGISRGLRLIEGEYTHSSQLENGDIKSIHLTDGQVLDADWFMDCSGFARLLLGKVMNEPVIDFTNYFPARSVIAWWDEPVYQVTTNAHAMKYGWRWNINLQHRSGNGYLYDPDHITEDQAMKEIEETLGKTIEPIAKLTIAPGMMRDVVKGNVIGIGLSSGFMEPLEANGVAIIIETLQVMSMHWNPTIVDDTMSSRINDRIWMAVEDTRDFLALHYRGHRRDTEFWQSHGNDAFRIPDTLKEKLEGWYLYYEYGRSQLLPTVYSSTAWLTVLQGLDIFKTDKLKIRYNEWLRNGQITFQKNRQIFKENVITCPTIEEWIKDKGIKNA